MNKGRRGQIAWNKGKHGIYSKETLRKIGLASLGRKHTPETKKKISEAGKGRTGTWNKGKRDEETSRWAGDEVGYSGVHLWLYRHYGKANHCEGLNCKNISKVFQWANISHKYKRDKTDWMQLCRSCHASYDWYFGKTNIASPNPNCPAKQKRQE